MRVVFAEDLGDHVVLEVAGPERKRLSHLASETTIRATIDPGSAGKSSFSFGVQYEIFIPAVIPIKEDDFIRGVRGRCATFDQDILLLVDGRMVQNYNMKYIICQCFHWYV